MSTVAINCLKLAVNEFVPFRIELWESCKKKYEELLQGNLKCNNFFIC